MSGGDPRAEADIAFHGATAHSYERDVGLRFDPYLELILDRKLDQLRDAAPGRRALDLGCGTGAMTMRMGRRGFDVVGVDHSPAMLEIARQRVAEADLADRISLGEGDITALEFEDRSFDLVTCQGVLHHLADIDAAVAEIARVLEDGGIFHIGEPCAGSSLALRSWARRSRRRAPDSHSPEKPLSEEAPIDAADLSRVLDAHGLDHEVEFIPYLDGIHRIRSRLVRRILFEVAYRPWRRRSGNLALFRGTRVARGA